jgi:hypothetical protein
LATPKTERREIVEKTEPKGESEDKEGEEDMKNVYVEDLVADRVKPLLYSTEQLNSEE